ncbi:hypothetical protein HY214_04545 [Candidatus Roizmanbacteria bacterium]|nr:hypothetical protein [Candidatus Roizmanbacteria bacterium]
MDTKLAKIIIDLKVLFFGESLKNKGDSRSCLFDPRKLLSHPEILEYIGKRLTEVVKNECSGNTIIGLATSGIAWGAICSLYSGLPFLYIRKKLERQLSSKFIEGIIPDKAKLILVDDLVFAGESKTEAIEIIKDHKLTVTDIVVIIDRQLQRKKDGPRLEDKHQVKLHSLITMEQLIGYMKKRKAINKIQLKRLIADYRRFDRWHMPLFAR